MIKQAKTPSGKTVTFYPEKHKYVCDGEELTSVTKWVSSFFPKFDAENVAKKYAEKRGLNYQDVLKEWKQKGDAANDLGHLVHSFTENRLLSGPILRFAKHPLEKTAVSAIERLSERFEFLFAEEIFFSPKLGLSGTIDAGFRYIKKQNNLLLLDWKTNEEIKKDNPWQTALEPISDFSDCNWFKYCLQLNTYKKILLTEQYFPWAEEINMALCHLTTERPVWYKVPDMQDRIKDMVNYVDGMPF